MNDSFETTDGRRYGTDEYGVVHQLDASPFTYDAAYVQRYESPAYADNERALSCLRLGWVLGVHAAHFNGPPPERLLDVGFGTGAFLKEAKRAIARTYGREIAPVPLPEGSLFGRLDAAYDIVTFWDSLEHHADLGFVRSLDAKMIAVSVPWYHGRINFDRWKHRKPDEHLHHFSPPSLMLFMASMRWAAVAVGHHEDMIRTPEDGLKNILTAAFVRA
jgi:hypothetical protein